MYLCMSLLASLPLPCLHPQPLSDTQVARDVQYYRSLRAAARTGCRQTDKGIKALIIWQWDILGLCCGCTRHDRVSNLLISVDGLWWWQPWRQWQQLAAQWQPWQQWQPVAAVAAIRCSCQ
jgi:hypothetical protein